MWILITKITTKQVIMSFYDWKCTGGKAEKLQNLKMKSFKMVVILVTDWTTDKHTNRLMDKQTFVFDSCVCDRKHNMIWIFFQTSNLYLVYWYVFFNHVLTWNTLIHDKYRWKKYWKWKTQWHLGVHDLNSKGKWKHSCIWEFKMGQKTKVDQQYRFFLRIFFSTHFDQWKPK